MIVVLQAGLHVVLPDIMNRLEATSAPSREILLLAAAVAMFVVLEMVALGFFATAAREGIQPSDPIQLLSIGRYFFWRLIRFELLMAIVSFPVVILFFSSMSVLSGISDPEKMPLWVPGLTTTVVMVILAKPLLLIPAVMVVCDRMVIESLLYLRKYRVLDMWKILLVFLILLGALFMADSLLAVYVKKGIVHWIGTIGLALLATMGTFMIWLWMVLFVAARERPVISEPSSGDPGHNNE